MKNQNYSIRKAIFVIILMVLVFFDKAISCDCHSQNVCVDYSQAKFVFIGKLLKVVEVDKTNKFDFYAHFKVEKPFKGKIDKVEVVKLNTSCRENFKFEIGEKYLVYSDDFRSPCNRTDLLSKMKSDLDYIKTLSETTPSFTVHGKLGITESEAKETRVTVSDGKREYPTEVDKYGQYSFVSTNNTNFHIKIVLPFYAEVNGYGIKAVSFKPNQTTIEYDVSFKPNECNFREITANNIEDTSSKISGKVIDECGKPIVGLLVSLYPNTTNQIFGLTDGKLAKTNYLGDYEFRNLSSGNYLLGVNLGKSPEFDRPYPTTFLGGGENKDDANIIVLGVSEAVSVPNLILSRKLKLIKVIGKLVWNDSTPVVSVYPNGLNSQHKLF
jgi:hypothetical protein